MKIAVLSGKGGAGKTMIAVNLSELMIDGVYVDCDVEEPNGHLFFKPKVTEVKEVNVKLPKVNQELCNGCRKCVEFCKFNALAYIKNTLLVFDEVCHSCGGCSIICPENAIKEEDKAIGSIQSGYSEGTKVISGFMNIGESSGVPIIEELNHMISSEENVIIDCPPGSACVVMESIKEADYCILVAEPTIFGTHNLAMVHELAVKFNKKIGVIINKTFSENNPAKEYCIKNNLPILSVLPYDSELGLINSNGLIAVREQENYKKFFALILEDVLEEVRNETTSNIKR